MATIKYVVKENSSVGTHSFFASPKSYSTLTSDDIKDEVAEGMGISPEIVASIIRRYMQVVVRNVQRGHRVKLADVLTVYPQISCSVKDEVDDQGNIVKVATADMLNVATAKSSIGATIAQSVQQSFAASVSWKRVSEKDGDEDTTDPDNPDDTGTTDSGTGGGGTDTPSGSGTITPSDGGDNPGGSDEG